MENLSESERIVESKCSVCGQPLDAVTGVQGPNPVPGDVSICLYCCNVAIFDDDLKLRKPTSQEEKEIRENSIVNHAIEHIQKTFEGKDQAWFARFKS